MEKVVLLLQGGAALGAYQAGAFHVIADYLNQHSQRRLTAIAGASIGAINGALIAQQADTPTQAAHSLSTLWRETFSQTTFPFFPFPGQERLNSVLTGMIFGHSALYHPALQNQWDFSAGTPFFAPYRSGPMRQTLEKVIGTYEQRPKGPRLRIRTVQSCPPRAVIFDSEKEAITSEMLVASASIPMAFPFHRIGGQTYWDGEFWPTGLTDLLDGLISNDDGHDYHIISVELYRPEHGLDRLLQHSPGSFRLTRIRRSLSHLDYLLCPVFDWSSERIEALIDAGITDTKAALKKHRLYWSAPRSPTVGKTIRRWLRKQFKAPARGALNVCAYVYHIHA
ncbi:patatin-like phospholipase family protein [Alkalilimnicola ehrlichii]|uniref:patatin-like phospholipase family protein n=1 Tax=Alkalilimnicola ehrlichii TaxID=351052 RepID=UPI0015F28E72|nr:patatin-like phospholipase family protein [Alkalilimnicola ehrlichii]